MCARKKNVYSDDFKRQAVEMSEESGVTVKEVSARLDITANLLYLWRKKYFKVNPVVRDQIELNGTDSNVENPKEKSDHGSVVDGRISELERKVKKLEGERDILYKAVLIPKQKTNNNLKQYYQGYHESEKAG